MGRPTWMETNLGTTWSMYIFRLPIADAMG
jgi:hypothetical protein